MTDFNKALLSLNEDIFKIIREKYRILGVSDEILLEKLVELERGFFNNMMSYWEILHEKINIDLDKKTKGDK